VPPAVLHEHQPELLEDAPVAVVQADRRRQERRPIKALRQGPDGPQSRQAGAQRL
jgi:hypothetical protein